MRVIQQMAGLGQGDPADIPAEALKAIQSSEVSFTEEYDGEGEGRRKVRVKHVKLKFPDKLVALGRLDQLTAAGGVITNEQGLAFAGLLLKAAGKVLDPVAFRLVQERTRALLPVSENRTGAGNSRNASGWPPAR